MGKIFCLMGKSASGKDTIYRQLLLAEELKLKKVVPYTTRPIREREKDGVQYYFVDEDRMRELEAEGRIIELRSYDTVHGIWYYFTVDDSQVDLENNDYLIIGTNDSNKRSFSLFFSKSKSIKQTSVRSLLNALHNSVTVHSHNLFSFYLIYKINLSFSYLTCIEDR